MVTIYTTNPSGCRTSGSGLSFFGKVDLPNRFDADSIGQREGLSGTARARMERFIGS